MALSASIVLEIRQAGSDTNSGGFHTGASGQDMSLFNNKNSSGGTNCFSTTADLSVTDGVTAGTTTITSATANFSTNIPGNLVYVSGGTGSVAANWYEVITRNSATSITVDRSTGLTTGTGVTLNIGGAFATPGVLSTVAGGIGGQLVSGQKACVQYNATAMNCSTSTAGPAGPCSIPSSIAFVVEGYEVTRGDRTGNRPTYKWTAAAPGGLTYLYLLGGVAHQELANLAVDCNAVNNVGGIDLGTSVGMTAADCLVSNASGTGSPIGYKMTGGIGHEAIRCGSSANTTGFSGAGQSVALYGCYATGGTTGFKDILSAAKCLAYNVPTGFSNNLNGCLLSNCTADTCSTAGFTALARSTFINSLASNCTGTGFVCGASLAVLHNCATYNNVTIASGTPVLNEGPFASGNTLTSLGADPYVSQGSADFRPNNNNPGGAQLRAAGIGVYGQTDSADIGAVQHTDPASGGPPATRVCVFEFPPSVICD